MNESAPNLAFPRAATIARPQDIREFCGGWFSKTTVVFAQGCLQCVEKLLELSVIGPNKLGTEIADAVVMSPAWRVTACGFVVGGILAVKQAVGILSAGLLLDLNT
jgi:hypothetical protein